MHALTTRLGARGAMLLVLAALWVRLFVYPLMFGSPADPGVFYYDWPLWVRLACWWTTIGLAVIAAWVRPRGDAFGWAALVVMPMQRLTAWVIGWVNGVEHAPAQVALYALLVTAVMVTAAMRPPVMEPSELPDLPERPED